MASVIKKKQSQGFQNGLPWRRDGNNYVWNAKYMDIVAQIVRSSPGTYRWTIKRGEDILLSDVTHGDVFWDATHEIQKAIKASETLAYLFTDQN